MALAAFIGVTMAVTARMAGATEPTPSPGEALVRSTIDSVKALPASKGQPKVRRKLLDSIDSAMALDLLAEQALGKQWAKLAGSERRRFVALFTEALEKLAYPRAAAFLSQVELTFLGDERKGSSEIVRTMVAKGDNAKAPVVFDVAKRGIRWQIIDVTVDGESLSKAVAARIQQTLKKGSYKKLVEELHKRVAEADKAS